MLLVHLELTYRAGFSISWANTDKTGYLKVLSDEIESPGKGILDAYLLKFKGSRLDRDKWGHNVMAVKGLDGLDEGNRDDGDLSDPDVVRRYQEFEQKRGYSYKLK